MASRPRRTAPLPICAAALCCSTLAAAVQAQSTAPSTEAEPPADLPAVTVVGRSPTRAAAIGGFGDEALARTPLSASVVTQESLRDSGGTGLSALTRFDAAVGDAYNAAGYWTNFVVRGYELNPRYNYRRDGLPINAETTLPLDNKARVEVLKGTNGIQAGTSSPGGLVNLVVKRPDGPIRAGTLGWREHGTLGAAVDLGDRFGAEGRFGLRLNAAYEHLDPMLRAAQGHRRLLAVAGDWRPVAGTLIEAEVETSRQSQPSQPGFSLLGDRLPSAGDIDPRINLNDQPWSQPVVMSGTTASLRWQQRLTDDWRLQAHLGLQRLRTDDRLAYPFGCSNEAQYLPDRYCTDGSFDLYDFRSEGERRDTDALDVQLQGRAMLAGMAHQVTGGVLVSRSKARFRRQAYNYTGPGTIDGESVTPANPELTDENTDRDERTTEFYLRHHVQIGDAWGVWLGLRHSRIERESVRTDGSRPIDYAQSFTTPWIAVSRALTPDLLAYASWGRGIESEVAPNRPRYTNAGEPLPALKSRQFELGLKYAASPWEASLAGFDIDRPRYASVGEDCTDDLPTGPSCTLQRDGTARHRGVEAAAGWRRGDFALNGSLMWLDAELRGVQSDASLNGKRPVNVPRHTARLQGRYNLPLLPGAALLGHLTYEGRRAVLPDNSIELPSWTRVDLAARYQHRAGNTTLTWLLGVDNVTDRRAWRESPYQFDHVYLYPLEPRTWRLSLQAEI